MKRKGFTLIELIVVVGIIGILASLAVISLSRQQARSRDARRVGDLTNINTAIQSYIAEKFEPAIVSTYTASDHGGWDYSSQNGRTFVAGGDTTFMQFLSSGQYMSSVPRDPINDGTSDVHYPHLGGKGYAYAYYYYGAAGYEGNDVNGMTTYVLAARLESGKNGGNSAGVVSTYSDYPNVTLYYFRQTVGSR